LGATGGGQNERPGVSGKSLNESRMVTPRAPEETGGRSWRRKKGDGTPQPLRICKVSGIGREDDHHSGRKAQLACPPRGKKDVGDERGIQLQGQKAIVPSMWTEKVLPIY